MSLTRSAKDFAGKAKKGSGLWTARLSAWLVNMASIGVALFTGGMLL